MLARPEGVEAYKKDGPKFIQRLVAKQKLRSKQKTWSAQLLIACKAGEN